MYQSREVLNAMETHYRCRKCGNGFFSIDLISGFTTPCSNCKFVDLEKRVELYGAPRYVETPKKSPQLPRPHIDNAIEGVINTEISKTITPVGVSDKDIKILVENLCILYVSNENANARNTVFSWVDGLGADDQNELINFGLRIAKSCKPFAIEYLKALDRSRYAVISPHKGQGDRCDYSKCEYCGGSKCRWCNHTGISWTYWMRFRLFGKGKSLSSLLRKRPNE